jgi:GNAT superfamily N-acetyltransferase
MTTPTVHAYATILLAKTVLPMSHGTRRTPAKPAAGFVIPRLYTIVPQRCHDLACFPDQEQSHPGPAGIFETRDMNANNLSVRPLAAGDRAAWGEMWKDYLAFYETSVEAAVYDSTFARLLGDDPRDFSCLLACDSDRPVGLVHYLFHRHAWKVEDVCYLQDLFARPDVRGKGVGRALIEAVYAAADARGAPSVYWLTQEFNATARQLYDRVGQLTPFIRYNRS